MLTEVMAWHHDKRSNQYHVLVNRADRDAPDVTLKDFPTRKTRLAGKTKLEGIDVSTHMILRPNPDGRTALLMVTQGARMGIVGLEPLFGSLVKLVHDSGGHARLFEFDHPSAASGDKYTVRYGFECTGHKSATLDSDLANGRLMGVELISHKSTKFDSGGNLELEAESITLKPGFSFSGGVRTLRAAIRDGLKGSSTKYDSARVRFKDHSGKPRVESFELNALDEAFVRREYIRFDTDIQSSYKRLSADIITQMQGLL